MRYLLDTNIVSALALRRSRRPPVPPILIDWLLQRAPNLFLAAVSAMELEAGVLCLGRVSPGRYYESLFHWYEALRTSYASRVLPLDLATARVAAAIADRNSAAGLDPGPADIMIAATAARHGMTLLTRNLKHFRASGVVTIDPFAVLPED